MGCHLQYLCEAIGQQLSAVAPERALAAKEAVCRGRPEQIAMPVLTLTLLSNLAPSKIGLRHKSDKLLAAFLQEANSPFRTNVHFALTKCAVPVGIPYRTCPARS
jgi:hypothetical protein